MKGYLYAILASSSSLEVSIFFSCRNGGISLHYIGILQYWSMPIKYRGIPAFIHLKKILTSGLLEDANIV
jgi:hypothetical protein